MKFRLYHDDSTSIIEAYTSSGQQVGHITYTTPSHKYQSENDVATLRSEDVTYGDDAAAAIFEYMKTSRK